MPWGDRTGPAGLGPMTGRAAGYCAGYSVPGYANPAFGRGFGFGRGGGWGRGRGYRNWYYATGLPGWARAGYAPAWGTAAAPYYGAPVSAEQQVEGLRAQSEWLQEQLRVINERIEELESQQE
ncbi:MAG: DUF5320 domain-containing protein [Chloroflexota bacterium]|nr:DUF5320 domain-containing protein [Chloroflexota bacterium]